VSALIGLRTGPHFTQILFHLNEKRHFRKVVEQAEDPRTSPPNRRIGFEISMRILAPYRAEHTGRSQMDLEIGRHLLPTTTVEFKNKIRPFSFPPTQVDSK